MKTWQAHDDDGKPIRVLDEAALCEWPLSGDRRMESLIERVRLASRGAGDRRSSAWRIAPPAVAFLLVIPVLYLVRRLGWPGWAPFLAVGLVSAGIGYVLLRFRLRMYGQKIVRLVLEEGLCPLCGYNLVGLARGEVVRCPECSAAWKGERIVRAEPFAPGAKMGSVLSLLRRNSGRRVEWVEDARARAVPLVHPNLREPIGRARLACDEEAERRLIAVRKRIGRLGWRVRASIAALAFVAGGVMVLVLFRSARGAAPIGLLMWIAPVAFTALGIGLLLGGFSASPRGMVEILLEGGFCPSCGLALPHGQGRVECALCHAEWERKPD